MIGANSFPLIFILETFVSLPAVKSLNRFWTDYHDRPPDKQINMLCPHCLKPQRGAFNYYFTKRFNICFDCVSKEAAGVCPEIPPDMANEIWSEFAEMPIKWKYPE
jgi:hypothetical protein